MLLASLQGGTLRDAAQAHPVVYNKVGGEVFKENLWVCSLFSRQVTVWIQAHQPRSALRLNGARSKRAACPDLAELHSGRGAVQYVSQV